MPITIGQLLLMLEVIEKQGENPDHSKTLLTIKKQDKIMSEGQEITCAMTDKEGDVLFGIDHINTNWEGKVSEMRKFLDEILINQSSKENKIKITYMVGAIGISANITDVEFSEDDNLVLVVDLDAT